MTDRSLAMEIGQRQAFVAGNSFFSQDRVDEREVIAS